MPSISRGSFRRLSPLARPQSINPADPSLEMYNMQGYQPPPYPPFPHHYNTRVMQAHLPPDVRTPLSNMPPTPRPSQTRTGNNKYGAVGIRKCIKCRSRKARVNLSQLTYLTSQCIFDDENNACQYCADKGLTCGQKLKARDYERERSRIRRGQLPRVDDGYGQYNWEQVTGRRPSLFLAYVETRS